MKLKCALHVHTAEDQRDGWIEYDAKELLFEAKELGFDVVALTLHGHFFYSSEVQNLAEELGILLIPAIEANIHRRHTLILNATLEAERVNTFVQLREYRARHPECFVIAPHPFHLLPNCLGGKLKKNLDCYDAIEQSFFYTKSFNFNRRSERFLENRDMPYIATSDCHLLDFLDVGYVEVEVAEKSIPALWEAFKKGQYENTTRHLGHMECLSVVRRTML